MQVDSTAQIQPVIPAIYIVTYHGLFMLPSFDAVVTTLNN